MQGGVGIPILNAPPWISSIYGHFFIDVFKHLDQWIRQVAYEVNSNRMYIRACLGGSWSPWELIATATPPQVYDLPLAEGWIGTAKLFKTQENICVLSIVPFASKGAFVPFEQITTLPEGFIPSFNQSFSVTVYSNGFHAFTARILTTGAVTIEDSEGLTVAGGNLYLSVTYLAS